MQFPGSCIRPRSGVLFLSLVAIAFPIWAHAQAGEKADSPDQATDQTDPLKRPISDKQRKENAKSLRTEVSKVYKKWLNEDVAWIISDEERDAFKRLSNDEERDSFIENFWLRRDPTPDTVENEFKEEHYRRFAYANEHFPAGVPGWKQIAARCTSCTVRRMKSSRTPRAAPTRDP